MQSRFKLRVFNETAAMKLISDIIVNEFNFKLDPDNLDSDIICIEEHYKKSDGGCFWVAESIENYDNRNYHQIIGTTAIRNLKQFESTAELKRMYVSRQFRKLGIAQRMLDTAIDFAKGFGYKRIVLDTSKYLHAALYLKKGFVDIPSTITTIDVFMEKKL
jgi:putative acetyltransferase